MTDAPSPDVPEAPQDAAPGASIRPPSAQAGLAAPGTTNHAAPAQPAAPATNAAPSSADTPPTAQAGPAAPATNAAPGSSDKPPTAQAGPAAPATNAAPGSSDKPPAAQAGPAAPATADLAVCLLTYNNAPTVAAVTAAVQAGLERHFAGVSAAVVNVDAGSSDGTPELVAAAGLPVLFLQNDAPITERSVVPFHGVPGRSAGLRLACERAQRLGARAVVILEADVTSVTGEWLARLAGPLAQDKTDLVVPAYGRHRYDGTITNLILAPLIRALYGRRLRQPLPGSLGFSGRLVEHLLAHPRAHWRAREATDVWIVGTAIADGFSVWEAWLGPRRVQSHSRTTDLPAMMAQTLGAVFTAMDQHQDLWLEG